MTTLDIWAVFLNDRAGCSEGLLYSEGQIAAHVHVFEKWHCQLFMVADVSSFEIMALLQCLLLTNLTALRVSRLCMVGRFS